MEVQNNDSDFSRINFFNSTMKEEKEQETEPELDLEAEGP
jgi:hypothetical protein